MRRSKEQVIAKILEICLKGSKKTKIVYGSDLNFHSINSYLDSLTEHGHLTLDETNRRYQTTPKGKKLLGMIKEVHRLFGMLVFPVL